MERWVGREGSGKWASGRARKKVRSAGWRKEWEKTRHRQSKSQKYWLIPEKGTKNSGTKIEQEAESNRRKTVAQNRAKTVEENRKRAQMRHTIRAESQRQKVKPGKAQ